MAGNGSYQKDGGPTYQSIPTSNHEVVYEEADKSSHCKKVTIWTLLIVILGGVIYEVVQRTGGVTIPTNILHEKSSTVSSASSATGVTTAKNGKLKLFDDQSKQQQQIAFAFFRRIEWLMDWLDECV